MLNGDVMPNYYGTFQLDHSKIKKIYDMSGSELGKELLKDIKILMKENHTPEQALGEVLLDYSFIFDYDSNKAKEALREISLTSELKEASEKLINLIENK